MKIPNEILGSDTGSLNGSTNQTTPSNVNTPDHIKYYKSLTQKSNIEKPIRRNIQEEVEKNKEVPGSAKNRDTNSNSNTNSGESVR